MHASLRVYTPVVIFTLVLEDRRVWCDFTGESVLVFWFGRSAKLSVRVSVSSLSPDSAPLPGHPRCASLEIPVAGVCSGSCSCRACFQAILF